MCRDMKARTRGCLGLFCGRWGGGVWVGDFGELAVACRDWLGGVASAEGEISDGPRRVFDQAIWRLPGVPAVWHRRRLREAKIAPQG